MLHDFVQHLTSAGSLGQKPVCVVPDPDVQVAVARQTPGVPETLHAEPTAACTRSGSVARTVAVVRTKERITEDASQTGWL